MHPEYLVYMVAAFSFALLATLFWYFLSRRLTRERNAHELRLRLLQSMGSAKELADLLHSPEGQFLLADQRTGRDLRHSAVRAVQGGVILLFFGLGALILAVIGNPDKLWIVLAPLILSLAAGLLFSALSSIWLGRKLDRLK